MTAIVDYGAGNLTSVRYAFEALNAEAVVTRDPSVVRSAERVVFPGVGAAKSAMESLRASGLEAAVREAAETKPFLGICLGMQILFEHSEEDGGVETLGILPGKVRRFPDVEGFKVPEIGWNQVRNNRMIECSNSRMFGGRGFPVGQGETSCRSFGGSDNSDARTIRLFDYSTIRKFPTDLLAVFSTVEFGDKKARFARIAPSCVRLPA